MNSINQFLFEMVQKGQDGSKGSKTLRLTSLAHFGTLTSLPCLAIFGPKWSTFVPSSVMNGGPQSKKKAHHKVSYVLFACRTPKDTVWNMNMAVFYEKCQK